MGPDHLYADRGYRKTAGAISEAIPICIIFDRDAGFHDTDHGWSGSNRGSQLFMGSGSNIGDLYMASN